MQQLSRRGGRALAGLVIGVIFGGVAAGSGIAGAHGGDASRIHACVEPKSGEVKIVSPSAECRAPMRSLDWDTTAPAPLPAQAWFRDADADGFGDWYAIAWSAVAPPRYVADNTDCNDSSAAARPGSTTPDEFSPSATTDDHDCNGLSGEDLVRTWWWDHDGDGAGDIASPYAGGGSFTYVEVVV